MGQELLPCPFCETEFPPVATQDPKGHVVICTGCSALGPTRRSPDEAITAWNQRAGTPPDGEIGALVERLRARDAQWQRSCDEWIADASKQADVSQEAERVMRDTIYREAADALEAFAANQEELRHALTRICDAYELVCADTGKDYHKSPSSVYAHCRALIARGDKPEVGL